MKKTLTLCLAALLACLCASALAFDAQKVITVFAREDGSGTRGAFVSLLGIQATDENGALYDDTTLEAIITNATSVMLGGVASDRYAIGYVSMGALQDVVKPLAIDGIPPTADAIREGRYALARPFLIALPEAPSEAASDFIAFILSEEGQQIVEGAGYVAAMADARPYTPGVAGRVVIAGSSSVTPAMEKLREAYVAIHPGASVQLQESDSTTGMQSVLEGLADIGMASRDLTDSELARGLSAQAIALDGIAVIVHPQNPVEGLTKEAVRRIFTGAAETWEEALAQEEPSQSPRGGMEGTAVPSISNQSRRPVRWLCADSRAEGGGICTFCLRPPGAAAAAQAEPPSFLRSKILRFLTARPKVSPHA